MIKTMPHTSDEQPDTLIPEGLQIDPKEIISSEQIIDVLQHIEEEMRATKGKAYDSVTEASAHALVTTAYTSIDKTVYANSVSELFLRGIRNPTPEDIRLEMTETKIRTEDFINTIKLAYEYITDQAPFERQRQELLRFFEIEIQLLENQDVTSPTYNRQQIQKAIATLKLILDYYAKGKDIKDTKEELTSLQEPDIPHLPKVRGKPVTWIKGKAPKEWIEDQKS